MKKTIILITSMFLSVASYAEVNESLLIVSSDSKAQNDFESCVYEKKINAENLDAHKIFKDKIKKDAFCLCIIDKKVKDNYCLTLENKKYGE